MSGVVIPSVIIADPICGAAAVVDGVEVWCNMRAKHPEVEGHFDSHVGIEWR